MLSSVRQLFRLQTSTPPYAVRGVALLCFLLLPLPVGGSPDLLVLLSRPDVRRVLFTAQNRSQGSFRRKEEGGEEEFTRSSRLLLKKKKKDMGKEGIE